MFSEQGVMMQMSVLSRSEWLGLTCQFNQVTTVGFKGLHLTTSPLIQGVADFTKDFFFSFCLYVCSQISFKFQFSSFISFFQFFSFIYQFEFLVLVLVIIFSFGVYCQFYFLVYFVFQFMVLVFVLGLVECSFLV